MTSEEQLDNLEKKLTVLQCALQEVRRATLDVAAAWRDLPPALAKRLVVTDETYARGVVSIPFPWMDAADCTAVNTISFPETTRWRIVYPDKDGQIKTFEAET